MARCPGLAKEKAVTRTAQRRPPTPADRPADKPYPFEAGRTVGLLDLFEGRPQLVMHHFMFGPDWDQGCPSCASAADGIGRLPQLDVRSTTLVAVSRAPDEKLAAFRERMGWSFPWYSSYGSHYDPRDPRRPHLPHLPRHREPHHTLTVLGRQEEWEAPKGRAVTLGLQVGGPSMRLPDEYDTP